MLAVLPARAQAAWTIATDSGLLTARLLLNSNRPVIRLRVYTRTASLDFSAT